MALRPRLVLVLLYSQGLFYNSREFHLSPIGNLETIMQYLDFNTIDELVVLDVGRKSKSIEDLANIVESVSKNCFVPIAVGGGINNLADIHTLINSGADKVVVNSITFKDPSVIVEAANVFGAQALIRALDVRSNNGNYQIFCDNGQSLLKDSLIEVLHSSTTDVYGEILLTSIDHDGRSIGYDIDLLRTVSTLALQPIIAMGGVGDVSHFQQAIENGIPAVAAANIFHFLGRRLSIFRDSLIEVDPQHRTRLWKFQEGHPL